MERITNSPPLSGWRRIKEYGFRSTLRFWGLKYSGHSSPRIAQKSLIKWIKYISEGPSAIFRRSVIFLLILIFYNRLSWVIRFILTAIFFITAKTFREYLF